MLNPEQHGFVFDIMRFSTRDGPGIRTTVFLKGCPLACLWCHNPESQSTAAELLLRPNLCIACGACAVVCPAGAIRMQGGSPLTDRSLCRVCGACVEACTADARSLVGHSMGVDEVLNEVLRDRVVYGESGGGVTFSGGEPLMQPGFLLALLQASRACGLHTTVDTSGCASWDVLDAIRSHVDLFLYDIKTTDSQAHLHFTGMANDGILANLRCLSAGGHSIVVRVPLVPGCNDDPASLEGIGQFTASLPGLLYIELLPYHTGGNEKYHRLGHQPPLEGVKPPGNQALAAAARHLEGYNVRVVIGG